MVLNMFDCTARYSASVRSGLLLSSVCVFSSPALSASDDLFDLSLKELLDVRVVTAASGYEQNIKDAPASVTVIEAAEWQARGAKNLVEAVRGATSINLTAGAGDWENVIQIRGLSGESGQSVKILIDGVPINRIHDGAVPRTALPLHGFKRIEIVRSPGSVVYGADAFGGVINLVSYDQGEQADEVRVSGGEFDTYNVSGTKYFDWDGVQLQLAVNYQHTDGDPDQLIESDLQTNLDGVFGTSASLAPDSMNTSNEEVTFKAGLQWDKLSLNYYGAYNEFGYGVGVVPVLDPDNEGYYRLHQLGADYELSGLLPGELTLSGWYQYQKSHFPFDIFPAGAVLPVGADGNLSFSAPTTVTLFSDGYIGQPGNKTDIYEISLTHVFTPAEAHQIRWQLGYQDQDYEAFEKKNFGPGILNGTELFVDGTLTDVTNTPYVYMPKEARHFVFASIQDEWQLTDSLLFSVGGRFDDYSDFGSTFNPRAGLNWSATEKLTVKAFGGTAFRAPAFTELHAQNNPLALGNKDVNPEEITTYELGADYRFSDQLTSSITLFQYRAEELIQQATGAIAGSNTAQNVGELDGDGLELELRWRPSAAFDIEANYSYLESEDDAGTDVPNVAGQLAGLSLNWQPLQDLNANLSSSWVMDRQRAEGDSRDDMDDYAWVTARVGYKGLATGLELAVIVNNLTDDDNARFPSTDTLPDDQPLPGRQFLVEANFQF